LALVLGALLGCWVSTANGQVPSGDSVVGQGRTGPAGDIEYLRFEIDARSGPSGEGPSGHVTLEIKPLGLNPGIFEGRPVSCLSVSANHAVVGFKLDPLSVIPGFIVEVEDNGPPDSDPPDGVTGGPVDDPSSCVSFGLPFAFKVVEGDVAVTDALPIGFTSNRTGDGDIYSMGADGSAQTRLTAHPAFDGFPTFSAGGKRIAFESKRTGNGDIWVMNADGSAKGRLTTNAAADSSPAWSPSGKRIAFASKRTGNGDIYVMNVNGSGQRRLTTSPAVDSSPDAP
jgi:dipeptidyl aminopeptidase/acylaminoacyl peptidase